jgi:hypothetical protein
VRQKKQAASAQSLPGALDGGSSMTKSPVAHLRKAARPGAVSGPRSEHGATTAEYAVVTAAGCGFAAVLMKLLGSEWGQELLKQIFDLLLGLIGLK